MALCSSLLDLLDDRGDLGRVEDALREAVRSDDAFLTEVASHLIAAGGKRLRPAFAIAAAARAGAAGADARPTTSCTAAWRSSSCTSGRSTTTT